MKWALKISTVIASLMLPLGDALAQTSSFQMNVDPLPRFNFSLRIDLGAKMRGGFEKRPLDDLFQNRPDYWNSLFGSRTFSQLQGGIKDFASLSSLQTSALLRLPGFIEQIQRDAVTTSPPVLSVEMLRARADAGVDINDTILDVAFPAFASNQDVINLTSEFITKKRGGFNLSTCVICNMATARAYKVALMNEQGQVEPYLAAQAKVNSDLKSQTLASQKSAWSGLSTELVKASGVSDHTIKEPVLDLSPVKGLSLVDRRLNYAIEVAAWIDSTDAINAFNPLDFPDRLSPAETKLLDAIQELAQVPDSAADAAAKEQLSERKKLGEKIYRDTVMDIVKLKPPHDILIERLKELLKATFQPTLVGDGQAAARDHSAKLLTEKLGRLLDKRFGLKELPIWPEVLPPAGPVFRAP
jgi:hypothetical protein